MSGPVVPQPKLPHVTLPNIRNVPVIPHVGSAGAQGTTYVGTQFGNLPDLHAAIAIKTLKKSLEEQVYALIQGELPQLARAPIYAARAAQLVNEIADVVATLNDVIAGVTAEANAAIAAVNGKVADLNAAKAALEGIPAGARNAVQQLMIQRYTRYASELNAQVGRLNTAIATIEG
jgi:ferritin-like metal-binding protein YciE